MAMTLIDLDAKVKASKDKLDKRINTTKKMEQRVAKTKSKLDALNHPYDVAPDRYMGFDVWFVDDNGNRLHGDAYGQDAFWILVDYKNALNDHRSSEKKIEEVRQVYMNWVDKYNKAVKTESGKKSMPEVFQSLVAQLTDIWTEMEINKREQFRDDSMNMDSEDFNKRYGTYDRYRDTYIIDRETFARFNRTDSEIRTEMASASESWVWDLYNRVVKYVGIPTDFEDIHFNGYSLNGYVWGTDGAVELHTIVAGGPVQRVHNRTLIKKIANK